MNPPRRFVLRRSVDATGVSGAGDVACGVEFPDGTVAIRWNTSPTSTAVYASSADLITLHGHNGGTKIVWLDPQEGSW